MNRPTVESVMSEREMFDHYIYNYNTATRSASRALLATVNEVLRRIAGRERRVEGFVYTDAVEEVYSGPMWNSTPFFLSPKPKVCYATLIIGEPYQPKPQRSDKEKIEAALKVAADDHFNAAQKMARILRGEEEA